MKNKIRNIISKSEYSCVAIDTDGFLYQSSGLGVKPIIKPMRESKEYFKGKYVGDKIVGKAAALLLALSGAKYVYGLIMSSGAVDILSKYNIDFSYDTLVEYIENRDKNDMCPLEKAVIDCNDKDKSFEIIERTIAILMGKNNNI